MYWNCMKIILQQINKFHGEGKLSTVSNCWRPQIFMIVFQFTMIQLLMKRKFIIVIQSPDWRIIETTGT